MRLRVLSFVLVLAASPSAGADDMPAEARTLFDEARRLMNDGEWQTASQRLEEALALQSGRGIKYQLAVCYEKLGRTASARVLYLQVANESHVAQEFDRETIARQHADRIELRVPKLTIKAAEPIDELVIHRDASVVAKGAWGAPLAVDPGEHLVQADAPGHTSWSTKITLAEGENKEVVVPALIAVPDATANPAPITPKPPASSPWRTPMIVLGAIGLGVMGAGFVFAGASASTYGSASAYCGASDRCTARGVSMRSDALLYGDVATALVIGGIAMVVGATVVWLWNPKASRQAAFDPFHVAF